MVVNQGRARGWGLAHALADSASTEYYCCEGAVPCGAKTEEALNLMPIFRLCRLSQVHWVIVLE
jgi:hypothetical protein